MLRRSKSSSSVVDASRRAGVAGLLVVSSTLSGCIDTSVAALDDLERCVLPSDEPSPSRSVVLIRAVFDLSSIACSGVAVTPRLVLTALGCVVRPSALGDPGAPSDQVVLSLGSVDVERTCSPGRSWAPVETGDFAARLGPLIEPTSFRVFPEEGEAGVAVRRVATSGGGSRCVDGLAVLVLDRDLNEDFPPIRLDDATRVEEAVTLRGHCPDFPRYVRRDVDARVEAVTGTPGTETTPPRSITVNESLTGQDVGGGVFSFETGALIGIVTSGAGGTCSEPDPSGRTIALRLAPFRRMLLETADREGETLRAEWPPGDPDAPLCSEL